MSIKVAMDIGVLPQKCGIVDKRSTIKQYSD